MLDPCEWLSLNVLNLEIVWRANLIQDGNHHSSVIRDLYEIEADMHPRSTLIAPYENCGTGTSTPPEPENGVGAKVRWKY